MKTSLLQGAAKIMLYFVQVIDLGLGLETFHCRPRVGVRIRARVRTRVWHIYD